jgi:hypothetical protein
VFAVITFLAFMVFPIEKGIKHTIINFSSGIYGFHSRKWQNSETIDYINNNLRNSNIYSNSIAGIYANTGLESKRISNFIIGKNREENVTLIIFNNTLPAIDSILDTKKYICIKDSVIDFDDSFIIIKR